MLELILERQALRAMLNSLTGKARDDARRRIAEIDKIYRESHVAPF